MRALLACRRSWAISKWPLPAATMSGVHPSQWRESTYKPCWRSKRTNSVWPFNRQDTLLKWWCYLDFPKLLLYPVGVYQYSRDPVKQHCIGHHTVEMVENRLTLEYPINIWQRRNDPAWRDNNYFVYWIIAYIRTTSKHAPHSKRLMLDARHHRSAKNHRIYVNIEQCPNGPLWQHTWKMTFVPYLSHTQGTYFEQGRSQSQCVYGRLHSEAVYFLLHQVYPQEHHVQPKPPMTPNVLFSRLHVPGLQCLRTDFHLLHANSFY